MKVRFRVTTEDVGTGIVRNCLKCPVALSMARRGFHVTVGQTFVVIHTSKDATEISFPDKVQYFIKRFDAYGYAGPMQFTLEIPAKYVPKQLKKRK